MANDHGDVVGATRRIRVGCEFHYRAEIDTPAVFQVQPRAAELVALLEQAFDVTPAMGMHGFTDLYGNECQRLILPAGDSELRYDALVAVPDAPGEADPGAPETPPARLPDDALLCTLPSRYCRPEQLADEAWELSGGLEPGYRRVRAICDHVHGHVRFDYLKACAWTASEVYATGFGVCRDFAHLAITFCRALSIPARYAFGYLPDMDVPPAPEPMNFAAWMEVYLDGRWWTFDPRNNTARKGRVLAGRGRDAIDVAMVTTFGGPVLRGMTVWAEEAEAA